MSKLTSDIIFFDIVSRVPVKSLARFRSVSKQWCKYIDDDPYFAMVHNELSKEQPTPILYHWSIRGQPHKIIISFNVIEIKYLGTVLESKKEAFLDFVPDIGSSFKVSGSCNGLLYLATDSRLCDIYSMVIHPLKKQCFKLPPILEPLKKRCFTLSPILLELSSSWHPYVLEYESSGLGFDASTNTFKVVCVFCQSQLFDQVNKKRKTAVHVLGMESWREIPTLPAYPIAGEGVFAHGHLYWLVSNHDRPSEDRRQVISFDVTTEEFGLIHPPKETIRCLYYQLVDLHGEVGYLHSYVDHSVELWVLKEREWAIYCCFDHKPPLPKGLSVKVLGRWNKDGDILIAAGMREHRKSFIYSLKNGRLHSLYILVEGNEYKDDIYMYPSCSVFSIRGTKKNAYSITN